MSESNGQRSRRIASVKNGPWTTAPLVAHCQPLLNAEFGGVSEIFEVAILGAFNHFAQICLPSSPIARCTVLYDLWTDVKSKAMVAAFSVVFPSDMNGLFRRNVVDKADVIGVQHSLEAREKIHRASDFLLVIPRMTFEPLQEVIKRAVHIWHSSN